MKKCTRAAILILVLGLAVALLKSKQEQQRLKEENEKWLRMSRRQQGSFVEKPDGSRHSQKTEDVLPRKIRKMQKKLSREKEYLEKLRKKISAIRNRCEQNQKKVEKGKTYLSQLQKAQEVSVFSEQQKEEEQTLLEVTNDYLAAYQEKLDLQRTLDELDKKFYQTEREEYGVRKQIFELRSNK